MSKVKPPLDSIKVGRWKSGDHEGTSVKFTPAGIRWWLDNIPVIEDEPLEDWLKPPKEKH